MHLLPQGYAEHKLREHHRPGYWSGLGDQLMAIQRREAERQAKRQEANEPPDEATTERRNNDG